MLQKIGETFFFFRKSKIVLFDVTNSYPQQMQSSDFSIPDHAEEWCSVAWHTEYSILPLEFLSLISAKHHNNGK